jgi:hypothetical protein
MIFLILSSQTNLILNSPRPFDPFSYKIIVCSYCNRPHDTAVPQWIASCKINKPKSIPISAREMGQALSSNHMLFTYNSIKRNWNFSSEKYVIHLVDRCWSKALNNFQGQNFAFLSMGLQLKSITVLKGYNRLQVSLCKSFRFSSELKSKRQCFLKVWEHLKRLDRRWYNNIIILTWVLKKQSVRALKGYFKAQNTN